MKLFVNKKQKRRAIIGFPLLVVFLLAFMPHGTFDPREPGFWLTIIMAIVMTFLTLITMVKYHIPESDRRDHQEDH